MMALHLARNALLVLAVLASCMCIAEAATNKNERGSARNGEESSHESDGSQRAHWGRRLVSVASKKNELEAGSDRKTMHRLIGGHLKSLSRQQLEKETYEAGAWDDGLLLSSAGNGKEKKNNSRTDDDDEKKTLAQQVKEGKYGLIQNEIYPEKPKRPGIISYLSNPEVPKDTAQNLGGLDEEEIWLAENHVLVLRGGNFPGHEKSQHGNSRQKWAPIDNYEAPKRQVKIPSRPKVPPPFPVQLAEGGPVGIIQANTSSDPSDSDADKYGTEPYYPEGFLPGEGPFFPFSVNGTFPPYLANLANFSNGDNSFPYAQNITDGALGPFYHALPPGTVFLPPPNNQTDYDDDDDQSIYYPPRYTFYYPQDNTSAVPPGPLVPGIILPPPPDFFSALEETTTVSTANPTTLPTTTSKIQTAATKEKYTRRPSTTPQYPKTHPTYLPPRKTSAKPYKSHAGTTTTTAKLINRTKYKNATNIPTTTPNVYYKTTSYEEATTLPPRKPASIVDFEYYSVQPLLGNQVTESSAIGKNRWSASVTSTSVPLLAYYATTPSPLDVTPATITKDAIPSTRAVQPNQLPNQASYYFYEETSDEASSTTGTTGTDGTATVTAPPPIYYRTTTTPSPYYKVEPLPLPPPPPALPSSQNNKQYYKVESLPSQERTRDYNSKLINSLAKEARVYQYSDSGVVRNPNKVNVKSQQQQGQRVIAEPAPIYYQTISVQPSVEPKPEPYYYSNLQNPTYNYEIKTSNNPAPVYQYSYESAEYRKQKQEQPYYKSQTSLPPSQRDQNSYEYQDIQSPDEHYDYVGSQPVSTQRPQPQNIAYDTSRVVGYSTTTLRPVVKATANPSHAYFTKQDERLLDDVTKEYFNIFGKKLPEGNSLASTTPIYAPLSSTTESPRYHSENTYVANDYAGHQSAPYGNMAKLKIHYNDQTQKPYSLEGDTLVNYKPPLPPINPDSEFISVSNPETSQQSQSYRIEQTVQQTDRPYKSEHVIQQAPKEPIAFANFPVVKKRPLNYASEETSRTNSGNKRPAPVGKYQQQNNWPENRYVPSNFRDEEQDVDYTSLPISLADDVAVNYQNPRPTINPDAEFIGPIGGGRVAQIGAAQGRRDNKENAYFAYQLPGNGGGHFYFLTPQAVSQKQDENGGYLYPRPRGPRLIRRRRGPGNL